MKKLIVKDSIVLLDNDDFEKVNKFRWRINKPGYVIRIASKNGKNSTVRLHRYILDLPSGKENKVEVDHINGNKLDNRKENLRLCNRTENLRNMGPRKTNTSGYKGVQKEKDHRGWTARIQHNKKTIRLGSFETAEEAAEAYNKAAREYFGKFAFINKLDK